MNRLKKYFMTTYPLSFVADNNFVGHPRHRLSISRMVRIYAEHVEAQLRVRYDLVTTLRLFCDGCVVLFFRKARRYVLAYVTLMHVRCKIEGRD